MANKLKNIELRSEEVQDILSKVPHWMIRWGSLLILAMFIMLFALSWFIKYPDIITSQILITTQIPPQKVYAKSTGKLDTILVLDNQLVKSNQALAVIENTANLKDVFYLKSMIETNEINENTIYFPFENLPILFLGELETDFALFENEYLAYTLNRDLGPFENENLANKIGILELEKRLQSNISQKELYEEEVDLKLKDQDRYEILFDKGVVSAQEYEAKKRALLQEQRNYENIILSISKLRQTIGEAKKTARGTIISQTREEIALLKNVIQSFNQLKKRIRDWELAYVLQTKLSGNVSFLNVWNKNQLVNQGDLVFTVIPDGNHTFIGKLKVPLHNSGKIKRGQKVNVKLLNYPEQEFGMLTGTISNVSSIPDDENFYIVDINFPDKLITSYNKELTFKQEMRGIAEIITEDLRLIERVLYQFRKVLKR